MTETGKNTFRQAGFVGLFLLALLPLVSSPLALCGGFAFSLLFGNPFPGQTAKLSKSLLKISVIGLGFGVNFLAVIEVGKSSLVLTFCSIVATLLLGRIFGQLLGVTGNTRALVAFGTAICGGSAIAAMAPVIKAKDEEIAVSLATVFALNALALILFPPLGHLFGLDQHQFGLWAALAIHDTSSVVGAAATFGTVALAVATTAKLTRALWILPCSLVAGVYHKSDQRAPFPLFILGFIAAAFINTWRPEYASLWGGLHAVSRQALVVTLFLIGAGLTRQTLRQVGLKPLLLGILLWCTVSAGSLFLLLRGYIG